MTVDQLREAVEYFSAGGDREAMRARFREAVLALPPGGVQQAWDDDILTVSQCRAAMEIRKVAGLWP